MPDATSNIVAVVSLTWGNPATPTIARYVASDDDVTLTVGGLPFSFASAPELEIDDAEMTGGTEEPPLKFRIASSRLPGPNLLRRGIAHAPVAVETGRGNVADNSYVAIWSGNLVMAIDQPDGKPGLVEYQAEGIKRHFSHRVSLAVLGVCPWVADGDPNGNCRATIDAQAGTVASVSGSYLTVSGLSATATVGSSPWWQHGSVELDGLSIGIEAVVGSGSDTILTLDRSPPPEWAGQAVTVRNGCGGTITDCRNKFGNEARFGGFGLAMPAFNPQMELTDQ